MNGAIRLFTVVLLFAGLLGACAAPPRPGDASSESRPVRAEHFRAPMFRVHYASHGGARVPRPALIAALTTIQRHLGRPVELIDHGDIPALSGERWSTDFPVYDHGAMIASEAAAMAPEVRRLASPRDGIVGAVGVPTIDQWVRIMPVAEPGTAFIMSLPGPEDGIGHTGYATSIARPDRTTASGLVVLHRSVIDRRSNLFVSREKLYQWTITHELGHVLGVPADNSHIWDVPGIGAGHCTHPECVMYTGFDWRVLVTGLLRGWPMDFCRLCAAELAAARDQAAHGANGEPDGTAALRPE